MENKVCFCQKQNKTKNQTTAWDKIPEYQSVRVSKDRGRSLVLVKQGATVKQSQCEKGK
jgi:hypothetical protein